MSSPYRAPSTAGTSRRTPPLTTSGSLAPNSPPWTKPSRPGSPPGTATRTCRPCTADPQKSPLGPHPGRPGRASRQRGEYPRARAGRETRSQSIDNSRRELPRPITEDEKNCIRDRAARSKDRAGAFRRSEERAVLMIGRTEAEGATGGAAGAVAPRPEGVEDQVNVFRRCWGERPCTARSPAEWSGSGRGSCRVVAPGPPSGTSSHRIS